MTPRQRLLEEAHARNIGLTELLNLLQEHGQISDNVVQFNEIAPSDAERATIWLRKTEL